MTFFLLTEFFSPNFSLIAPLGFSSFHDDLINYNSFSKMFVLYQNFLLIPVFMDKLFSKDKMVAAAAVGGGGTEGAEPVSPGLTIRTRNKTRSRKNPLDLRKKVLQDQTCRHLNFSSTTAPPVKEHQRHKESKHRSGGGSQKQHHQKDTINANRDKENVVETEGRGGGGDVASGKRHQGGGDGTGEKQEKKPPQVGMSCTEKTLIIRRKLEKIIHKKEKVILTLE